MPRDDSGLESPRTVDVSVISPPLGAEAGVEEKSKLEGSRIRS